ncbi:MAG: ABC transporter ATP-binding protein [Candidatus Heimdallarchaeota archaeon]|nr:ABC transporter ATP-binding protein [Candidatus Heimdallarchaeota archaeon]
MKVYTAALIDKPLRIQNHDLRKKISSDLKKALHVPKNAITSQELNTFIFISGQKQNGSYDPNLIEKIEKGTSFRRFSKYNAKNESRFRNYLKSNMELRETSQIVKNFIKEIDSSLPKTLDKKLKTINTDLPKTFCDLSMKSFIALWDFEENQDYRFYLPGFDFPVFTGKTTDTTINIGNAVDQLLIVNFFMTFLKPTIVRIEAMHTVLNSLEKEFLSQHYKSSDEKLQTKFELFLRILIAKLSALQELENLLQRIFNLFEIPRMSLMQYNLKSDYLDFNTTLARISEDIKVGKSGLHELGELIQRCQLCIRDYLDIGINGVKTTDSIKEFQQALKPISELSVDLFVEAEVLKIWADYFGSDLPFFSFNAQLLSDAETEQIQIDRDVILAVRGLFKNYHLGRNTVYAIRGLNLDIKEGEFVAIVGSSGAGKTTLLNCMASLDSPDHGSVYFRGKDLHRMKDNEKSDVRLHEMGFIFQSYALLPNFTTRENVALPADLAGNLSKDLKKRIEDLLKGVGIDQQAKQFPAQLSGGQMQRVAIARALTNAPSIIFADEPTGDLDSTTGHQVMALLQKFHQETGTTIVIITHEAETAAYAQRQILMEDGIVTRR